MTPTRLRDLALLAIGAGLLTWLAGRSIYLTALPGYAPVPLALLAVTEAGMARVVHDRLTRRFRPGSKALHPVQVARAAVVAKASSAGGAILLGGYLGLLVWTLPRRGELLTAGRAAVVAGLAALAALALVAAALRLEAQCRTTDLGWDRDG